MTISTTTSKVGYNGNGVTTAFSVPFLFLANADLTVVLLSSAGVETTLTLSTHYTVTGAGNDSGGTLTMVTPPAVGERLTILREVALTQETDYISGDSFPAETHERALDRLTMIDQQQNEVLGRAMRLPVSDTASAELPAVAARASKYLAFDASGNPVAVAGTSSSIVVTPFMEGLLDDADAPSARATLDVPSRSGSGASGTWDIGVSGNAATATQLQTARTIGGVSFDGSANVDLPGVNTTGNQNTTGNAATATKLSNDSGSAPSYSCRAWVEFDGTNTTIRTSANVSSITDYGVGDYGINFSTAMADANYCLVATAGLSGSAAGRIVGQDGPQTSSQARVAVRTDANVSTDTDRVCVAIFR